MNKLVIILSLLFSSIAFSQQSNDWIDYSQKYYSFKVWEDGIYKIDYFALTASGVPVSSFSSDNLQLFAFEKEQDLYIEDGNDGSIDPGDYILFYGQKNTIWMDSIMYGGAENVGNEYYPHFNDTINYFLNNSKSNGF